MILKDGEHRGGSRIFSGGGAFVSCSTSTPINHRIPVVLENRRSPQGGVRTPCTLPLDPPLEQISSLETFRFYYVVSARKPASFWRENVVADSTTSFSENVEVAKTSYQIVRSFITLRSGESVTSFAKVNGANFLVKNGNMKLSGESIFSECAKNVKSNLILAVVLVLEESKGL